MQRPKFNPHALGAKPIGFDPHAMGAQPISVVEELTNLAQQQAEQPARGRPPQIQEEFSNPTVMSGFSNLPKYEQLQRIGLSQFDPANQTSTGTMVPPGAYESDATRMAASVLPSLAQPELSMGKGMLSRYAINPLLNLAGRLGAGTASNLAYQLPELKNKEDWKNAAQADLGLNALIEGATLPWRIPAHAAEVFNPLKYATGKANQIKNEFAATKATMDEMYRPVNEKYNDMVISRNPKKYLSNLGVERADLYPDAKIVYDKFIENPTFKGIHDLQSKLGADWAKLSQNPSTLEKAQLFQQQRESLKDRVQQILSKDKNSLDQYNLASQYASQQHFPYLATPTLRKIAKGKMDVNPNTLAKSIHKATEKTVGKSEMPLIPKGHALHNHLNDLNSNLNFGKAMQYAVPAVGGGILGEMVHPGLGGILGGGAGAVGGSQIANMASKFGAPNMTSFVQNPLVQGIFERTRPWWYAGGRGAINLQNQNR